MTKSAPVILPERSLARNSTRSATSVGRVNRPVAKPPCDATTCRFAVSSPLPNSLPQSPRRRPTRAKARSRPGLGSPCSRGCLWDRAPWTTLWRNSSVRPTRPFSIRSSTTRRDACATRTAATCRRWCCDTPATSNGSSRRQRCWACSPRGSAGRRSSGSRRRSSGDLHRWDHRGLRCTGRRVREGRLVETLHAHRDLPTRSDRRHLRRRPTLQSAGTARRHDPDCREVPELLIPPPRMIQLRKSFQTALSFLPDSERRVRPPLRRLD